MVHPLTGERQNFTPYELYELAQYGWSQATKGQDDKNKDNGQVQELDPNEKIAQLEQEIKNMQEADKREKQANFIMRTINQAAAKFDLTKDNETIAEQIKIITLARLNNNPRLNAEEVFANEVKKTMEALKLSEERKNKSESESDLLRNSMTGTMRGGGVPSIDKSKEFKAEDMKSNASRMALTKFLQDSGLD